MVRPKEQMHVEKGSMSNKPDPLLLPPGNISLHKFRRESFNKSYPFFKPFLCRSCSALLCSALLCTALHTSPPPEQRAPCFKRFVYLWGGENEAGGKMPWENRLTFTESKASPLSRLWCFNEISFIFHHEDLRLLTPLFVNLCMFFFKIFQMNAELWNVWIILF